MKRRPKAPPVDPAEYRDFISGLQLNDISVGSSSSKRLSRQIDLSRKVDVAVNDKASFSMRGAAVCDVIHSYSLRLCYQGEDPPLVVIECEFAVTYQTAKPMAAAYFDVFKRTSLPLNTWPYWREFVHSTFARMGLPPFILPSVKRG
ncbi:hypothetical protein FJY69_04715 [candidate division WOR-3 bacterium]|nr:hypothetical protein [candidate division WOR-3 bacterium]